MCYAFSERVGWDIKLDSILPTIEAYEDFEAVGKKFSKEAFVELYLQKNSLQKVFYYTYNTIFV